MEQRTDGELYLLKLQNGEWKKRADKVALEQNFSVIIQNEPAFSVSCTPADLEELILGQLYFRGYMTEAKQIEKLEIFPSDSRIEVSLKVGTVSRGADGFSGTFAMTESVIFAVAGEIFEHPGPLFQETGCAHCCALYTGGSVACCFEDIGRHNALDKAIGYALKHKLDLRRSVVFTSGRISGDYMKKVVGAQIPAVVSRAAVTSEAAALANTHHILMLGFVRGKCGNLYTGIEKLIKEW